MKLKENKRKHLNRTIIPFFGGVGGGGGGGRGGEKIPSKFIFHLDLTVAETLVQYIYFTSLSFRSQGFVRVCTCGAVFFLSTALVKHVDTMLSCQCE